jgi:regulator of sigma E protease
MLTVVAFVLGLSLLIGVHEYGHYRMARACGVRVLRFSIGFGKPLLSWQSPVTQTEYVLALVPLGGYVRMLDEREGEVPPALRQHAFNTQPLLQRALIVAAGPAANLLLAVVLYAGVHWVGMEEPAALLASPVAGSVAEQAGLRGGERVVGLSTGDDSDAVPVASYEHLRWLLARAALNRQDVSLVVSPRDAELVRTEIHLPLTAVATESADAQWLLQLGLTGPWTAPVLGDVVPSGAAQRFGLQTGDEVLSVDGVSMADGQQLRRTIRRAVDANGQARAQQWLVRREGRQVSLVVEPVAERHDGQWVGRIGAYVGQPPEMLLVRQGPIDGLAAAVTKTWDVSVLSVQMMGKMLIGEASLKNLSGPLTIADYAGRSASVGWVPYVMFLALISVSLGVLNLLPLPILDGGHLMYYLWEGVTGRPVSEVWQDRFQRGGVVILMGLMSIALFNDVTRLLG